MNYQLSILTLAITILTLAGCATTGDSMRSAPWEMLTTSQKQAMLVKYPNFTLQGSIGIHRDSEAWSAKLNWHQVDTKHYQINLMGPIGAESARIVGTTQQVFMQTSKGITHFAPNAETLVQKEFGWQLPVSSLLYWVRGLPVPGIEAKTTYNDQKLLTHLEQNNWTIDFDGHQLVRGIMLPTKINMTHDNLHIRLVINQWSLH